MWPKLLFQVRYKHNRTIYKLFQIPLLKIARKKEKIVFYLLGFLPFLWINKTKLLQNRYQRKLNKLSSKSIINVGFLVRENCKWSYETLYKKLKENKRFNPVVLIVDEKHEVVDLKKNIEFFKKYNYCVIKNIRDFYKHDIDILFYEQPWFDLAGDFTPENISKTAITLYVPYDVGPDITDDVVSICYNFYKALYKTFVITDKMGDEFKSHSITNIMTVGHPRLDSYLTGVNEKNIIWKTTDKIRIIYAPHHSFGDSLHRWGSWEYNGDHILKLAQENKKTTEWIFKPHPRFKFALTQLLGTKEKAQKVFDDWSKVSTIYDTGDYFDMFKTADLMISDCWSFKIEWLPTCKPYIQLISNFKNRQAEGANVDYFSSAYYKAKKITDIDKYFYMLVRDHKDPNKEQRIALANEFELGATEKIYKFLINFSCKNSL